MHASWLHTYPTLYDMERMHVPHDDEEVVLAATFRRIVVGEKPYV